MNRLWAHIWAASISTCLGGIFLPACAHDDSSLFIAQVVFPPTVQSNVCTYPAANLSNPGEFSGTLDVGLTTSYSPVVVVASQLLARGDLSQARTETNRVQLRGAVVRVTDSAGNQISTFTSLTEAVIDPSTGSTPAIAQAAVTVVDPATVDVLRKTVSNRLAHKTIIAFFKVFGQTLGGVYVESGEYQHVIDVCWGCLVSFPPESVDSKQVTPAAPTNCEQPFPAGTVLGGGALIAVPCHIGQDQPVDCRICHGVAACDPRNP